MVKMLDFLLCILDHKKQLNRQLAAAPGQPRAQNSPLVPTAGQLPLFEMFYSLQEINILIAHLLGAHQ